MSFAGKRCTGAAVLQHRRIRRLCEAVEAEPDVDDTNSIPPPTEFAEQTDTPLSAGQEQMLMLHSMDPRSGFYNQPLALGLYGAVDAKLLDACIQVRLAVKKAAATQKLAFLPSFVKRELNVGL